MALLPQNQRDQIMLFVVVLSVAAVGLYYNYVWLPKSETLVSTRAHVDSLETMNRRAKADVAKGSVQKLKEEAERLTGELDVMRQLVPTGNEVPVLLDQVSSAARRAGLELGDVQPEPVVSGTDFDVHRYSMSVVGDYHSIGSFLTNVGTLTRIVTPQNLTLAPSTKVLERRLDPNTARLDAKFHIQTYVAHTSAPSGRLTAAGEGPR